MHSIVFRCGLLLQTECSGPSVCVCVCLSVCWSRWALQNRLNRSRRRLGDDSCGPKESSGIKCGPDSSRRMENFGAVWSIQRHQESLFITSSQHPWRIL